MTTSFEVPWRERVTRAVDIVMTVVAFTAIVSLLLEHGQYLSEKNIVILQAIDVAIIGLFVADMVLKFVIARRRLAYLRQHVVHYSLLGVLLVWLLLAHEMQSFPVIQEFLKSVDITSLTKFYIVIIQIAIVVRLMIQAAEAQRRLAHTKFKPAHMLVGSFLFIICIGTVLLYSPRATPGEGHASFIDSLFTATSATCVTGLIVQDTGTYFSPFGQMVILVLIQIGGLGLMTFAAFFALVLGFGMGFKDRIVMQDVLNHHTLGEVGKLIVYILVLTVIVEAVGAMMLYPVWDGEMSTGRRIYTSVFHSISCFCNAGFSLFSTSFTRYRASAYLNTVACVLIVLGGLGFAVHRNLLNVARTAWRKLPLPFSQRRLLEPSGRIKLTLHTKVVLATTVALVVLGALVVWLLERDGALSGMSAGEQALASTFQSVTARTAGFNTVDTSKLSDATLVFTAFLMFIGASPGSTGGGIKTATFAMLLIAIVTAVRNRSNFEIFHRTIPRTLVSRAIVVVTVAGAVVVTSTILLCAFEQNTVANETTGQTVTLRQSFFEVVSAFGTVGLSTGITRLLTSAGKVIIIVTMLVGRIGPLTLVLALGQRMRRPDYDYPEENLMIG